MDATSVRSAIIAELTKASKHPQYAGRTLLEIASELSSATLRGFPDDVPQEAISIGQLVMQYFDDRVPIVADDGDREKIYKSLPVTQRRVLQLHVEEGLTYVELAARLRISKEHAFDLLSKAYRAAMATSSAANTNEQQSLLRALHELAATLGGEACVVQLAPVDTAATPCVRNAREDF